MKKLWLALAALAALAVGMPNMVSADEKEDKLDIFGDFRGRAELFDFAADPDGSQKQNRGRLRYRFRINLKANVNEYMYASIRLASGGQDSRSANQTLGSPVDFGGNEFTLRRAYIAISPFKGMKLPGKRKGSWIFNLGRTNNPVLWKRGGDKMLWDSDIGLAGANTVFKMDATGTVHVFANAGYYVLDENKTARDPFMAPLQGGLIVKPGDKFEVGAFGTFYYFDRLDGDFIQRGVDGTEGSTSSGGNIPDGLTGDVNGGSLNVVHGQASLKIRVSKNWPVMIGGGASVNTSAAASDSIPGAGKEDLGYNASVEIGDKKKIVRLGGGYYHLEANAFPSQFIDSDYLDGVTNRRGFGVWASRQILKRTDLNLIVLKSEAVEKTIDTGTLSGSDRTRIQFDLVFEF